MRTEFNYLCTYTYNFLPVEKLVGSRFADEVSLIAECFDTTTKLRFRDIEEASYIKFGTMKDRDPKLDIRSGQLKLAGYALVRGTSVH